MRFDETNRSLRQRADAARASWAWLPPLLTRIVLGLGFVQAGLGKWQNFDRTVGFFEAIGIPLPAANAAFVASVEVVGGAALLVGLLTRPFALMLSSVMVVALLTADRASFLASWAPGSESSPTDLAAFVFLLLLSWLASAGPGAVSVDRLFFRGRLHDGAAAASATLR